MTLIADEQLQEWEKEHEVIDRPNTIGCAAIDANGILVAGTSTGRITGQPRGRIEIQRRQHGDRHFNSAERLAASS